MFYETKVIVPVINRMNQFRKSSSEMVMDKITELVEKNGGDLTLSECAEKVGCHPSYIWRVMKNTKDMTFTDYVAGQKLEMAKRMLVETDLSVAEIAERLSYSNAQNFIRLFKNIWILLLDNIGNSINKTSRRWIHAMRIYLLLQGLIRDNCFAKAESILSIIRTIRIIKMCSYEHRSCNNLIIFVNNGSF